MRASDDPHFDASGPVGRYWLTNGVGFTVCGDDGRTLGVVAHVVVDRRQAVERLIVRRRGLLRRPRYVAIDPRAVESVLPESQLFLVPPAETRTVPASRAAPAPRLRPAAAAVGAGISAFGRALAPAVAALDRGLASAAEATLRGSRRAAAAAAAATARADARLRAETPKLVAWLSARLHEAGRGSVRVLRAVDRSLSSFARVLGDLAVLAAVGAVALWRRAEGAVAQQPAAQRRAPERHDLDAPEWRRDADAPLARERRDVRSARRTRR